MSGELDCQKGDTCKTYFTCGRGHDSSSVDHKTKKCELGYIGCITKHYRHECAHKFGSGPDKANDLVFTTTCKCGMSAMDHDLHHGP